MSKIENVLWKLFYFLILLIIVKLLGDFLELKLEENFTWFRILFLVTPVIILLLHSFLTLTLGRGLFFVFLASATGLIMEYLGLRDGTIFGGHYIYKPQLTFFNVPISVIAYWAVFIYVGYCLINSFLYGTNRNKPSYKNKKILLLPFLIILDAVVVTAIDLFMDPIQVKIGGWKWLEGGPYFGIPIGNFVGWFLVTIIVTGIFRVLEYFYPIKEEKYRKSVFVIPVLGYGILALSFALMASKYQMFSLILIGSLFMLPQVILNLIFFNGYEKKKLSL